MNPDSPFDDPVPMDQDDIDARAASWRLVAEARILFGREAARELAEKLGVLVVID